MNSSRMTQRSKKARPKAKAATRAAKDLHPRKAGRPSAFSQAIADAICERISGGESLRAICDDESMPARSMVFRWLSDAQNRGFRDQYDRARESQADALFDDLLHIADTPKPGVKTIQKGDGTETTTTTIDMIEHRRLQVDARKWVLARMAPKKYGDRVQTEVSGPEGRPLEVQTSRPLAPPEVVEAIGKLLGEAEAITGIESGPDASESERLKALLRRGQPLPPGLYAAVRRARVEEKNG